MTLDSFNASSSDDAAAVMMACCASRLFAHAMAAGRPYASIDALEASISAVFTSMTWNDVLSAMDGHPRIGARVAAGSASAAEQSGVGDDTRAAFADGNREYEARFGHVFLICASGLSGARMLAALRERLENDPDTERSVATAELRKITVLRARAAVGS